jgi:hypothetical protein
MIRSTAVKTALWGSAFVLAVTTEPVQAQTVLPPAVDAFVSAANALAKSANERVDLGRATMRLNQLRADLTNKILNVTQGKPIYVSFESEALLCEARASNFEVAARRNYIQAVAGRVEDIGKPSKIDNLESAFKSLFMGQSLDITAGIPTAQQLEANRNQIRERCQRDIRGFDLAYYGRDIIPLSPAESKTLPPEADALPAFGAVGALIDAIVSIITPVVVEGAKIVDEERRRAAVLRFLQTPGNIKKIEDSGMGLAREVSAFTWDKRLTLAGAFFEQSAKLRATPIDLSKNDNCKAYITTGKPTKDDGSLSDDFVLCWRTAWGQVDTSVAALLKAAEQYDQLADAGDTDNAKKAFEPLVKSLAAISYPGDEGLAKFWNWAARLVAFAQKVETAFSKENRQKIDKAIDDLVRAM